LTGLSAFGLTGKVAIITGGNRGIGRAISVGWHRRARRSREAEECAGAGVFLASAAADFVTGITLPVDGGYSVF